MWESDTTPPTCSIKAANPLVPTASDTISRVKSEEWELGTNSLTVGKHIYKVIDYAENITKFGVDISDNITKISKKCTRCTLYDPNNNSYCLKNEEYDCSEYKCESGYKRVGTTLYCYKNL